LAVSQGGYDHITELCDLCQPDLPLLKALMNTTTTGDSNIKADGNVK
jgi:hypothetical protein